MTKTLLSILIALAFFFGAAGVTIVVAQQSQPGEMLYAVRTWSVQMLHQRDKMQISGQVQQTIQPQSKIHEPEITKTSQSPAPLDVCDQSGTNGQCGSHLNIGADHVDDHSHHGDDGTNHQNDGTHHHDGGSNHQNNGSDHQENEN